MTLITIFRIVLLIGLIICALATFQSKKLLRSIILYTAYSLIMSIVWILLESPDLALTEAAVGAGVTGMLFFMTLYRLQQIDKDQEEGGKKNEKK